MVTFKYVTNCLLNGFGQGIPLPAFIFDQLINNEHNDAVSRVLCACWSSIERSVGPTEKRRRRRLGASICAAMASLSHVVLLTVIVSVVVICSQQSSASPVLMPGNSRLVQRLVLLRSEFILRGTFFTAVLKPFALKAEQHKSFRRS